MALSHRLLLVVVGVVAAAAVLGVALLWPEPLQTGEPSATAGTGLVDATLLQVEDLGPDHNAVGLLPGARLVGITARLDDSGVEVAFETTDDSGGTYRAGQRVRLAVVKNEGQPTTYYVNDFRRERPMLVLTALFVLVVVGFGRLQGVRALAGLVLTFVLIIGFIVPAILAGRSPVVVAVVGAALIMILTLYLSHGFNPKTTAAVVGTAGSLVVTGLLAVLFVEAASITGMTSEEARMANMQVGGLSLRGLLLAGIIIGGLGVLDDVTTAQSATVFELRRADPTARFAALVRGALSVGRDHIAATINTLFLAYAGASLPLLILFVVGTDSLGTIVTAEVVAVEVVRTLVGSIGLVAAVPLTTALAAALVTADDAPSVAADTQVREPPRAGDDDEEETDAGPAPVRGGADASTDEIPLVTKPSTPAASVKEGPEEEWEQRLRRAYGLEKSPRGRAGASRQDR